MFAERGFETGGHLELRRVTPEVGPSPYSANDASRDLAGLLETAGIRVHAGVRPEVSRSAVDLDGESVRSTG